MWYGARSPSISIQEPDTISGSEKIGTFKESHAAKIKESPENEGIGAADLESLTRAVQNDADRLNLPLDHLYVLPDDKLSNGEEEAQRWRLPGGLQYQM